LRAQRVFKKIALGQAYRLTSGYGTPKTLPNRLE
jgi:hypothetical protein